MNFLWLSERLGDSGAAAFVGLAVGLLFGICAQQSRFCLRAATIEFWRGSFGPRTAIWLLVFGAALAGTQLLIASGNLDTGTIRQLSATGTMSGAVIGGLLFGCGMILARGCASRLLVLSATGNLRALVAGLILTVVAQAALTGVLSPVRQQLSSLWVVGPGVRDMAAVLPAYAGLVMGLGTLALAMVLAMHHRLNLKSSIFAVGVGTAVVAGWWLTSQLSSQSFDPLTVQSVSFTGPSADTLMVLISRPQIELSFGIGLVPGVFLGSLAASMATGEFRIETFGHDTPLPRYIIGACLMGFGGMLAGGCAVGAGVTGGSVMALTAWVALAAMWLSAGLTDLLIDHRSLPSVLAGRTSSQ